MAISGRLSDLKILIMVFGNVTIKDILQFMEINKHEVA